MIIVSMWMCFALPFSLCSLLLPASTEKVYQRQITKLALSKAVVKAGANTNSDGSFSLDGDFVEQKPSFTRNELRDIFKYREDTIW